MSDAENDPAFCVLVKVCRGCERGNLEEPLTLSTMVGLGMVYEGGSEEGDHASAQWLPG